jgi:hypothetical protein
MKQFKTAELPELTPASRSEIETAAARNAIGTYPVARAPDALAHSSAP